MFAIAYLRTLGCPLRALLRQILNRVSVQ